MVAAALALRPSPSSLAVPFQRNSAGRLVVPSMGLRPSSHAQRSHVESGMSDTPRDRNLRAAPVHNLSPDGLAQIVSSALQAAFGDEKSGIKAVQRASNSNHRTAKNWWQGRNAPDARTFSS